MRFDEIPADYFAEFHRSFQGDTGQTFRVCAKCGGACEFNKIGTLMPGEREYMASVVGMSVAEFSEKFLDVLVMEDGMELDVLRLSNGCPFLDPHTYECQCRKHKVVLCDIYPIGFHVQDGQVEFSIDSWCPLSDTLRFRWHFADVGISALSRLPVPVEWYQYVSRYDDLYFDYIALDEYRGDRWKPRIFTIGELLSFQRAGLENDPKERFHPYPEEVVLQQSSSPLALPSVPVPELMGGSELLPAKSKLLVVR